MEEEVYLQCLEIDFDLRGIPFQTKQQLTLVYKGREIEKRYCPDMIVFNAIIVELKAVQELAPEHEAQLFNYMRIARQPVGYLLNFGSKSELQWKRFILNDLKKWIGI